MSHDPRQSSDEGAPQRGPYMLEPIASKHIDESRRMILRAAEAVPPGEVIVLGAGACDEIPLAELVARFRHVTLNDVERERLERALAAARCDAKSREEVDLRIADLTALTEPLVERIEESLSSCDDPVAAIEHMVTIVAEATSGSLPGASLGGKHDLVVASCVLSQLHFGLTHRAGDLFERRFPGKRDSLGGAAPWTTALYQLARRMEARFIDDLVALMADGGLVYLSESVQMCYVELTPAGTWRTEGTYRMLRSADLRDYVDRRLTIVERARWEWVVSPPTAVGQTGRLYDVQAIMLRAAGI